MTEDEEYRTWRKQLRDSVDGYGIFADPDVRWGDLDCFTAIKQMKEECRRVKLLELAVRWLEKDNASMKTQIDESRRSVNG